LTGGTIINYLDYLYNGENHNLLFEGAQGTWLDVFLGKYPYVTSSHVGAAAACLGGFPLGGINDIIGVVKAYDTYAGAMRFQPYHGDEMFEQIQQLGETTSQINWLNLDRMKLAVKMNSVMTLIVNKCDVLRELGLWRVISNGEVIICDNEGEWKELVEREVGMDVTYG